MRQSLVSRVRNFEHAPASTTYTTLGPFPKGYFLPSLNVHLWAGNGMDARMAAAIGPMDEASAAGLGSGNTLMYAGRQDTLILPELRLFLPSFKGEEFILPINQILLGDNNWIIIGMRSTHATATLSSLYAATAEPPPPPIPVQAPAP